jgi:peptidoglycan/xylan/chitin deacetylase (PgdA/CDA1 family)
MPINKTLLAQTLLNGLYFSQAYRLFGDRFQGVGVILTLHHVIKTDESSPFAVNKLLEISPEFLEQTIEHIISLGYDIISLDEVHKRLSQQNFNRRFVCFTLDDGYIDNYQNAYPIFKKYNIPFTIYVTTGVIEGSAMLWWYFLEKILLKENHIEIEINAQQESFVTESLSQKQNTFNNLYWRLRKMPLNQQHTVISALAEKYHFSTKELCLTCAMSWDMLKEIAQHPLATIGSHTVNHLSLAKLSVEDIKKEVLDCQDMLKQNLAVSANHFCYPYGDEASAHLREFTVIADLGFKTATTTRKQVITAQHAHHLHSLPRIPLNGHYQKQRYVRLLLSGIPTGLWECFKLYIQRVKQIIKTLTQ